MRQTGTVTQAAPCGGPVVSWAAVSEIGHVRALNEDSLLTEPPLFVVADGMGGHEAGEVASALAVERLRGLVDDGPTTTEAIASEVRNVNGLLRRAVEGGAAMGTTVVGLALVDDGGPPAWLVFNVGDSRAYGFAHGRLERLSHDHSYVQDLVDMGEIDLTEARTHPHRNVVTRALGAADTVRADYWVRTVVADERFLLCSDGVTSELDDDEIAEVLAAADRPEVAARRLVDRALDAGGNDNVTAVVVDVVSVPDTPEGAAARPRPRWWRRRRGDGHDAFVPGRGRAPAWERVHPVPEPTTRYLIARVPTTGGPADEAPPDAATAIAAVPDDLAPEDTPDDPPVTPLIEAMPTDLAEPQEPGDDEPGADEGAKP